MLRHLAVSVTFALMLSQWAAAESEPRQPPIDAHTVALWLFDETEYPHTTLTDASPYAQDLRLMESGGLAEGKYGNALHLSSGHGFNVCYAEWASEVLMSRMRGRSGKPSGLWGPTTTPGKLLATLSGGEWTCEFWLKLSAPPGHEAVLVELGQAYAPGFRLSLGANAASFTLENAYAGFSAACPVEGISLHDRQWHHVAFTYSAPRNEVRLFLDGHPGPSPSVTLTEKQPLPAPQGPESAANLPPACFDASGDAETFRQHRFNVALGQNRHGQERIGASLKDSFFGRFAETPDAAANVEALLDELRFSDVDRYSEAFAPPASLSQNYGVAGAGPANPSGPPLLFSQDTAHSPVRLGSRKHLFIDDVLIDAQKDVFLTVNPPAGPRVINRKFHQDFSVLDIDGKLHVIDPDGYSHAGLVRLWTSGDGLDFSAPDLGLIEQEGSVHNNVMLSASPLWCAAFEDANPAARPSERFKLTAWLANRGIYLYTSPDAVHWQRNETCALPLVSGGSAETFWDDQNGKYVMFLKRDNSFWTLRYPGGGRRACRFETREIAKPWPFQKLETPYFESKPFPAVTGEGPVAFPVTGRGEVYRTRAIKYAWAPDTYLAFVWRFGPKQVRQTELGVSRDGIHWRTCGDLGMYMPNGGTLDGMNIVETLAQYGLVRRGGEIWQYYILGNGPHGKGERLYVRTTQRLDGFVSLDARERVGTFTTKPLVFEGSRLELNAKVAGSIRVGLLRENGEAIPGRDVKDCTVIQGDSLASAVSWGGDSNVEPLAGSVVRLKFEMQSAKLFAFQFLQ